MSCIVHIIQVVHHEFDLVFVGDCSCECLELQFLDLLNLAVTDTLNYCVKILSVFRKDLFGSTVCVTLNVFADAELAFFINLLSVLEVLLHLIGVLHVLIYC